MATFTVKEVYKMATQIVAGLASNPASSVKGDQYDIEEAMKNAIGGVERVMLADNHEVTNDPLKIAVIEAAHKH